MGPPDIGDEGVVGSEDESEQAARYIARRARLHFIPFLMLIVVEPQEKA